MNVPATLTREAVLRGLWRPERIALQALLTASSARWDLEFRFDRILLTWRLQPSAEVTRGLQVQGRPGAWSAAIPGATARSLERLGLLDRFGEIARIPERVRAFLIDACEEKAAS
jgi:hypothetical protein